MDIFDKLENYSFLGKEILSNGRHLIGRAPHIAPQAWLHKFGAGLNEKEIIELELEIKIPIPSEFRKFLKLTNGLNIFVSAFCIYGKRNNYIRNIENSWQPFDIVTPNTFERPKNAKRSNLFVGTYSWDGSGVYIDVETGKVHYHKRFDATSLLEWDNFGEMLSSEIERIIALFDKNGIKIDPNKPTTPVS